MKESEQEGGKKTVEEKIHGGLVWGVISGKVSKPGVQLHCPGFKMSRQATNMAEW